MQRGGGESEREREGGGADESSFIARIAIHKGKNWPDESLSSDHVMHVPK